MVIRNTYFSSSFKVSTSVWRPGNPSQVVLGSVADMRDLEVTILNTRAQQATAVAARDSYSRVFERQEALLAKGAVSREEYEQSRFDADMANASVLAYDAQLRASRARYEQKCPENLPTLQQLKELEAPPEE